MRATIAMGFAIFVLGCSLCFAAGESATSVEATIAAVDAEQATVLLVVPGKGSMTLPFSDSAAWRLIKQAHPGDSASVQFDNNDAPKAIKNVIAVTRSVSTTRTLTSIGFGVVVLVAFGCLVTGWRPLSLVVGQDNRYSNSKFQMTVWFGVVMAVYLATVFLRVTECGLAFLGGVDIPSNLLMLSGLSGLTFGAAKAITTQKVADAKGTNDSSVAAAATTKERSMNNATPALGDLVNDDHEHVDIGDTQALFVVLLAVAIYMGSAFHFLGTVHLSATTSLPDVDSTLLAAFGLGQGAYLIKKSGSELGKG